MDRPWRIWIDTGGTFTDCIAVSPAGALSRLKVLSSGVLRARTLAAEGPRAVRCAAGWWGRAAAAVGMALDSGARVAACDGSTLTFDRPVTLRAGEPFDLCAGEDAPVLAARLVTGRAVGEALPPVEMRLGTTLATNALLERRLAPLALFITRGLGDLLEIGTQQRPDLFALRIVKPAPLHRDTVEVDERIAADGSVLCPLDPGPLEARARRLLDRGIRVAAVALLNAWANDEHERALATFLHVLGFEHVSRSSEMAPGAGLLARAQTAVVNAALAPVVEERLAAIAGALPAAGARPALMVMTSSGGLVRAASFRAKDSLLSGPAGGVVGAARAGAASGFARVISFDMGGTSTDAARIDGPLAPEPEHEVAGVRILAPSVPVRSVAAGGGSICGIDRGEVRVGPRSAGAEPGPACYGRGGPLTLTDANLLLGRIDAEGMGIPIDAGAARARAGELLPAFRALAGASADLEAMCRAFIEVADERMADAVRQVSAREGYDPAEFALVAFGGAAGQHACGVAGRLGIETVVVPADAGLLSAAGVGAAPVERTAQRAVLRGLDELGLGLDALVAEVSGEAGRLAAAEAAGAEPVVRAYARLRLTGQESSLAVECGPGLAARFARQYAAVFGHAPPARPVEVESVLAVARVESSGGAGGGGEPVGGAVPGPALLRREFTSIVVPAGWEAGIDSAGATVIRRTSSPRPTAALGAAVLGEVIIDRLAGAAREMGEVMRRTAISVNVRERLDFSCALLDASGELIVNAPHVPVHLGALGECVRRVASAVTPGPGDVAVTNHPAFGGSHLPDVTVVTPVHAGGALLGYAATRAHHAEIGGITPGSMPPEAGSLAEEGVVIPPMLLVHGGEDRSGEVEQLLRGGPFPSRAVAENLADLRAAVAANHLGAAVLAGLAGAHGPGGVRDAMERLKARAQARLAGALRRAGDGAYEAADALDDGSPIRVRVGVHGGRATIDFAGSAGVHPGNLNAPPAVVRSAVVYVLRLVVGEEMPLNEGLMRCVDLRVPEGILNPPFHAEAARCPAVAAGNTETSQRIVDVLLAALGLAAASQGTMNNVVFGDGSFGYYETICGGAGAGPGFDGASCVHTHMTNTRITDPEVLERRYPARLVRFARRPGSGGKGERRGGDGVVREVEFLRPVTLSVITQRRTSGPPGAEGGSPGARGAQRLVHPGGTARPIGPVETLAVAAGDRFVIETPGGGGWGRPAAGSGPGSGLRLVRP